MKQQSFLNNNESFQNNFSFSTPINVFLYESFEENYSNFLYDAKRRRRLDSRSSYFLKNTNYTILPFYWDFMKINFLWKKSKGRLTYVIGNYKSSLKQTLFKLKKTRVKRRRLRRKYLLFLKKTSLLIRIHSSGLRLKTSIFKRKGSNFSLTKNYLLPSTLIQYSSNYNLCFLLFPFYPK